MGGGGVGCVSVWVLMLVLCQEMNQQPLASNTSSLHSSFFPQEPHLVMFFEGSLWPVSSREPLGLLAGSRGQPTLLGGKIPWPLTAGHYSLPA